jgi:hypothetical protein
VRRPGVLTCAHRQISASTDSFAECSENADGEAHLGDCVERVDLAGRVIGRRDADVRFQNARTFEQSTSEIGQSSQPKVSSLILPMS